MSGLALVGHLSENELTSKYYSCPVKPLDFLNSIQKGYDIVFLCSSLYESIKKILSFIGIPDKHIVTEMDMHKYLSKENTMNYEKIPASFRQMGMCCTSLCGVPRPI